MKLFGSVGNGHSQTSIEISSGVHFVSGSGSIVLSSAPCDLLGHSGSIRLHSGFAGSNGSERIAIELLTGSADGLSGSILLNFGTPQSGSGGEVSFSGGDLPDTGWSV